MVPSSFICVSCIVCTDFETKVLEVSPKRPDALVIKNDEPNQVDTGVLPEQYTDERPAPIKSILFEQAKLQPDLYQVQPENDPGQLRDRRC